MARSPAHSVLFSPIWIISQKDSQHTLPIFCGSGLHERLFPFQPGRYSSTTTHQKQEKAYRENAFRTNGSGSAKMPIYMAYTMSTTASKAERCSWDKP